MSNRKRGFNKILDNIILVRLIVLAIIAIGFTAANTNYLSLRNLKNLMTDIGPYFVMSMGITFVLVIGSIDLSIGTMASASACLTAIFLPEIGIWSFIIPLLLGIVGGAINGFLVAKLKVASFIATLGTMSIWSSFAYLISRSQAVTLSKKLWVYINWEKIFVGIIPITFIGCMIIWAVLYLIQRSTPFGKGAFATGVNEIAAQIAGINIIRVKMIAFIISGFCSALAGIMVAAKCKGAVPYAGDAMTLLAIAAVVLGGTALVGGKGGMLCTLLGSAMVIMIQNGLNMVGITSFYQDIVFGILIIFAVYFSMEKRDRFELVK